MVTYKWEDLRGDNLPFGGQIAKGARGFACNLWNKYPDRLAYGKDPLLSPAKFYWNIVCAEEGVNRQPDPPPFAGGQCEGVIYRVSTQRTRYTFVNGTFAKIVDPISVGNYTGAIIGMRRGQQINQGSGTINGTPYAFITYLYEFVYASGNSVISNFSVLEEFSMPPAPDQGVRIVGLARNDGQLDNCGNPPSVWIPTLPSPQPGDETWNVSINDGNDVDLDIPLAWIDADFEMPLTFNFEVGEIVVDVGGVTIEFDKDNEWNTNERSTEFPDREFITEENNRIRDDIQDTVEDVKDTVEDIKDTIEEDKKPPNLNDYEEDKQEDVEEVEETDSEISFVQITLAQSPKKGKTILMTNPENNVYFIGYFAWTYERARSMEYPVRKRKNIFVKPPWATGYAYYSVNGASADISTFKKKLAPETLI